MIWLNISYIPLLAYRVDRTLKALQKSFHKLPVIRRVFDNSQRCMSFVSVTPICQCIQLKVE